MNKNPLSAGSEIRCIVCGGLNSKFVLRKNKGDQRDGNVTLRQCLNCQTVFLADWKDEFIAELYDYYAARIGLGKEELYDPINDLRYEQLLAEFKRFVNGTKVLDVGCGQGQFVDFMVRAGWNVSGIELSDSAVAICQQFGLPVKKMDFFDSALQPASFDLLTMFEVIEHLPLPGQFMARAEELLKPGGILYLTTPNFAALDRRILGSDWDVIHREHLAYFTPKTLRKVIRDNTNFEVVSVDTQNLSVAAMRRLLQSKSTTKNSVDNAGSTTAQSPDMSRENQQALRKKIESSQGLKFLKFGINQVLDWLGCGAAMTALCRKT